MIKKVRNFKVICPILLISFFTLLIPSELFSKAGNGSLTGFVYGEDGVTPQKGAVVKIQNVKTGEVFESNPADENGMYKVTDITPGMYIIGVEVKGEGYNALDGIYIRGNEIAKLSFALKPLQEEEKEKEEKKPVGFFKKPLGIAILIVGSAAIIYAIWRYVISPKE